MDVSRGRLRAWMFNVVANDDECLSLVRTLVHVLGCCRWRGMFYVVADGSRRVVRFGRLLTSITLLARPLHFAG